MAVGNSILRDYLDSVEDAESSDASDTAEALFVTLLRAKPSVGEDCSLSYDEGQRLIDVLRYTALVRSDYTNEDPIDTDPLIEAGLSQ